MEAIEAEVLPRRKSILELKKEEKVILAIIAIFVMLWYNSREEI